MNVVDNTTPSQTGTISFDFDLHHTWVVGGMAIDTVVTFTLTPTASGTHLSLVQTGFKPANKQAFGGQRYGWNLMGGKLVDLLARIP